MIPSSYEKDNGQSAHPIRRILYWSLANLGETRFFWFYCEERSAKLLPFNSVVPLQDQNNQYPWQKRPQRSEQTGRWRLPTGSKPKNSQIPAYFQRQPIQRE